MDTFREVFLLTLKQRQAINTRYSLRAFARDLHVSPSTLSEVLAGKRMLSRKNAQRAAAALCLPPNQVDQMMKKSDQKSAYQATISLDSFSIIADWFHLAILNLVKVDQIKSTAQIASRLGISENQAKGALGRLLNLELLCRSKGVFKRVAKNLTTLTDIPSAALRKHNREKMELGIAALENVPLEERDISSQTIAFDPKDMKKIKNEINKFKEKIESISASRLGTEVYAMNIQFFPLTKRGNI